jgi:hypothetical protein
VIRKISLALVLMTVAGVATAKDKDKCEHRFWFDSCKQDFKRDQDFERDAVKAPEIDPASAMAGLTLLAGGLVVLRGRRRVAFKE